MASFIQSLLDGVNRGANIPQAMQTRMMRQRQMEQDIKEQARAEAARVRQQSLSEFALMKDTGDAAAMAPARVASVEDVKDVTRRVGGGDSTDSDAVATYVLWPRGLANAGDASLPAASGVLLGWCLPACLANGRASAVVVAAVVPADGA